MVAQSRPDPLRMSPAEYLVWEAEQEFKHEYENGTIIDMTEGTIPHSQVAANFSALLIPHVRGQGYKVAISDAKVAIPSGKYYYPDIEIYQRRAQVWEYTPTDTTDLRNADLVIQIVSLDFEFSLSLLYGNIDFVSESLEQGNEL